MRDFHLPGRSTVHAENGMAATAHPLASLAAIDCLREGGNAVDAAVAACAVLCVVEPMMTGIGGDCFALVAPGNGGEVVGINGSGRAPMAASAEWFMERDIDMISLLSPHSVTVPGAIDAWSRLLDDHGTRGLDAALAPAIRYAEEGFPVTPRVATMWNALTPHLEEDENASRQYLIGGRAPRPGEVFRTPQLGNTLRKIAEGGRDAFYTGELAEDMVNSLNAKGALHTLEDFASQRSEYVTPICVDYGGYTLLEIPPNGQGIIAGIILNALSGFDLSEMDPTGTDRFHIETEISRLAFEVRDSEVADPEFTDVAVDYMLSAKCAQSIVAEFDIKCALPEGRGSRSLRMSDTTYLTVVDRDRNAVSFINSLFKGFGSGIVSPSGVAFHNRGAGFVVEPGHPNNIEGGKRPLHTLIPGMLMDGERPYLSFGVMGGDYQPVGHTHLITNLLDFGMDVQEAIDCPRMVHQWGHLQAERGVPAETIDGMKARGHDPRVEGAAIGGAQAIRIHWDEGTLEGGSDPRKDGCALGY